MMVSELQYASNFSGVNEGKYEEEISKALEYLLGELNEKGALTKDTVINSEQMMNGISAEAKKIKMICAAHAHIDMNWMWGYPETVALVLETFRTMLDLMKEYPGYKFSQSQASVYRIVEEHDPDMLEEIKERVREGRWEVTASTWVETDKNMPNGESLARHILYTKRYLSELLDINPETLNIDFEPDTFGHNRNVPEILANGGVKYYYHCRGYDKHNIYRWKSPSGKSILVYRDYTFYNGDINPSIVINAPKFCKKHGIRLVVDNTFCSPYLQRPLTLGADVVLHSITKFINGHADVVGGVIVTKTEEDHKFMYNVMTNMGPNMDPHQAFLVIRGLKTLSIRIDRAQANAIKIANYLLNHPAVAWVKYPGHSSHPQYALAKKQQSGGGSMISFGLKGGFEAGKILMNKVNIAALAVSLGGVETLIQHPASMTHAKVCSEAKLQAGITDDLVRYSVGIEDVKDLIEDLDTAFSFIE